MNEGSASLLGVRGLAEKLNVPVSWVYCKTRTREIPFYKVGKYCRFSELEVLEWLRKRKNQGA